MTTTETDRVKQWYIVHTYSGFEDRVRETLRQRAEALGMGEAIGEVRIPTETIVEYRGGKKRETQRKFFPGYILVEMEMSDAAWHVVKNTPKVTDAISARWTPARCRLTPTATGSATAVIATSRSPAPPTAAPARCVRRSPTPRPAASSGCPPASMA